MIGKIYIFVSTTISIIDVRSLHVDRIAVDSARAVVLEIRGGDSGFFVGLHETTIFYICRMNGNVLSGDSPAAVCVRLPVAAGERAAGFQLSLIVDVSLEILCEVSSRMEIAEVLGRRLVGEAAFHCDGHIPAAGEIAGKGHGVRFDGQVFATLDGAVFSGQDILRNEGNIRDAAVFACGCFRRIRRCLCR